jgi:hypothetical protein
MAEENKATVASPSPAGSVAPAADAAPIPVAVVVAPPKTPKTCITRDGKVRVANQHTGDILFPVVRVTEGGVRVPYPPLVLHAGQVTHVDQAQWDALKKIPVVSHYLDRGLLAESRNDKTSIQGDTSTDLEGCIPEHLQATEQAGNVATASVRTDKVKTGEVKVG